MRLSLAIIAGAAADPASETGKTWVDGGGTIGRAEDCDWVLSDPAREISRCHARIRFMNDGFYLEDTSANGVFLNNRENRLDAGELHRLQDGERLFISDYQITVRVEADAVPETPAAQTPAASEYGNYDNHGSYGADDVMPQDYAGGAGDYAQWDPLASLGGEIGADSAAATPSSADSNPRQPYLEEHFAPPPVRSEPPATPAPGPDPGGGGGIPADWWKQAVPGGNASDTGATPAPPQSPRNDPPAMADKPQPPEREPAAAPAPPSAPHDEPEWSQLHGASADTDKGQPLPADARQEAASGQSATTPEASPMSAPQSPAAPPAEPPAQQSTPVIDPASDNPAPPPPTAATPPVPDEQAPRQPQQSQTPGPPAAQQSAPAENQDALAALLAGAGINADDLSAETAEDLGHILRVTVTGVMDLLRARSELKNEFRMPATLIQARENNPLKFSTSAEDALHNLLVKHNPDYMGPVDAFEASFNDLRSHQIAMLAGMREAFMDMFERFDPEKLEQQFDDKGQQGSVMGRLGRRRDWDLYKTMFAGMREDMDANFHRLFGESFIRAYEDRMARLQQPSNNNTS